MMRVLESARLELRYFEPADAPFILELINDPDWIRFIGDRGIRTVDDARAYILNGPVDMYRRLGFGLYLVGLKGNGTPIGMCGFVKRDNLNDVDLGFAFLPRHRGQGYALEAAAATLAYGADQLGLERVAAIVSADNAASLKLLVKLGFRFDRTFEFTPGDEVHLYIRDRTQASA